MTNRWWPCFLKSVLVRYLSLPLHWKLLIKPLQQRTEVKVALFISLLICESEDETLLILMKNNSFAMRVLTVSEKSSLPRNSRIHGFVEETGHSIYSTVKSQLGRQSEQNGAIW